MPASRKTPVLGIHKFGGASLFDAAAVRHAATLIAAQKGGRLVVASAMAGVTDALLQGATRAALGDGDALCATATALRTRHLEAARVLVKDKVRRRALEAAIVDLTDELELLARGLAVLRELTPRTSDYIVARGERLSARLLASTLAELGVKSEYVDATEVVRTDDTYGGAAPDFDRTEQAARDRLAARITRGVVPVVPGFIGRSASGHVATLGRGGSDLTATLLARALKATSITLWKDVAGFLPADPRIVSDAQVIPQLTPREAAELNRESRLSDRGRAAASVTGPPLNFLRSVRRTGEQPPPFMVSQRDFKAGAARSGWPRSFCSRSEKLPLGISSTSSANMVNRQRMRKRATASAVWPWASKDRPSAASRSATSRVTWALIFAGLRESGSVQIDRRRSRTLSSRRSSRRMR